MPAAPVPVTLGSPQFRAVSVRGCGLVHAWFPPNSTIELHSHEHATFAVMLNGSFDLAFQQKTYECTPSSIAVEPAGESHTNYVGTAGADVLVLQPVPDETELWRPFAPLFDSVSFLRHGGIAGMAARLAREIRQPDVLSGLAMEGLLLDMLVAASRIRPETRRETMPPWLSRVQQMLHEEPTATLSVSALAGSAGVHPAYLSRAFRRFFHCSLGEYTRRIRLEWTAERLIRGNQSIAALALEAGFSDQSHFTRCFKKFYQATPGFYREAYRNRSGLRQ